MNAKGILSALGVLLLAPALLAADPFGLNWVSPVVSSGAVRVGEWNSNFTASKTYAEENHLPYIIYFGETGCDYCAEMSKSLARDEYFLGWQTKRPVVLCYIHPTGDWTEDQRLANQFAFGLRPDGTYEQGSKPGMAFHLLDQAGKSTTLRFTGRSGRMPIGTSGESVARQLADSADAHFEEVFFPSDGVFKAGNTPAARLEIEYGRTTYVDVPVTRTNSFEIAMSNRVVATYGTAYREERWASWAVGDETVHVRIPAPTGIVQGETVALALFNEKGTCLDTSAITCVKAPGNNPKNPLWIGAKTAAELAWGEWTMDYDRAREKAAAAEGEAYTLVLVGGSTWCPDCVKVDHYLVDTPEFHDWAVSHRVSCVAIDVPKMNATEPSLLTYGTCRVSDRYVNCTEPRQERYQSGAGYLSRNMIAPAEAAAVAARNHAFLYNDTRHGGLCRPENMDGDNEETGPFKTGIPCLILMRKDGSVAGRIYQFNNVSPSVFEPGYITRLNELLGQVEDPLEEDNDHYLTTGAVLKPGVDVSATISPTDARDVWRLDATDARARVTLSGTGPATNVTLRLSRLVADEEVTLAEVAGPLEGGLSVEAAFTGGDVYVTVEAGTSFGKDPKNNLPTDEAPLVRAYGLSAAVTVIPSETTVRHAFDASVETVALEVAKDKVYWIEGLAPLAGGEGIVLERTNVYRATVDGSATAALAEPVEDVRTVTCRTWTGGEIGFDETELSLEESKAGVVPLAISRTSGESGCITAHVALTLTPAVQKALDDGRIAWSDTDISWANGDAAVTNLPLVVVDDNLHDGDLELVFNLTLTGAEIGSVGIREGDGTMTVTILEDDPEAPGTLAIASARPAFAASRTVMAEAGSTVSLGVSRTGGATGDVTAYLSLRSGETELARSATLTWLDRSRETVQWGAFTVPGDYAGQCLTVVLVATGEASADANAARATLQVLSAEGPAFATDALALDASRGFVLNRSVSVDRREGFDEILVRKRSGSLPSGVQVGYEDGRFTVSGAPSVSGTYAAAYQVFGRSGAAVTPGTTLSLSFEIADAVAQLKAEMPSLAATRTYRNIPMTDGSRLTGLLTITVPATGRASARYRTTAGTWSYSAGGWSDYAAGESVSAALDGTRASEALALVVRSDGTAGVAFDDPGTGARVSAELPAADWGEGATASAWQGQYTVQMPQTNVVLAASSAHVTGEGFLALRMTAGGAKSGTMLYSGLLPNGLAVSGSATLVMQPDGRARLPFTNVSKASQTGCVFAGAVDIRPNAADEHTTYRWSVKAAKDAVPYWVRTDALGGEAEFDVFGGYYDRDEIWDCFAKDYSIPGGFDKFGFTANADGAFEVSPKFGFLGAFAFVDAFVTEDNVPYLKEDAENPDEVTMTFKADTGVLSGKLRVPFATGTRVTASWRGIVLPGWGGCATCEEPGSVAERPFASGACWFTDRSGNRTLRNGCAVTLDRPVEK